MHFQGILSLINLYPPHSCIHHMYLQRHLKSVGVLLYIFDSKTVRAFCFVFMDSKIELITQLYQCYQVFSGVNLKEISFTYFTAHPQQYWYWVHGNWIAGLGLGVGLDIGMSAGMNADRILKHRLCELHFSFGGD